MEMLEKASACEDRKAGAEKVWTEEKTAFKSAASKFKWAKPLHECAKRDVH